jgi:site-specific DNA-methyltransferase (adenine-specific)
MDEIILQNEREEWYDLLVEDCRAIITEAVFTSRWALVEGYHLLGERIVTDESYQKAAKGNLSSLIDLSNNIGISERRLYFAIQFYEKYPSLDTVPEGKNISWNKIVHLYLPAPKPTNAIPLPLGKFNLIYADPPWQYDNSGFSQSAANHYPTMSTDDICSLPIGDLSADSAVLFLWGTSPLLPEALKVMMAWGFEYKAGRVWIKPHGPTIGWWVNTRHELLLIGSRGESIYPLEKLDSVIEAPSSDHSKKPNCVYLDIEKVYPDTKKIELFARNRREGWEAWGNEV